MHRPAAPPPVAPLGSRKSIRHHARALSGLYQGRFLRSYVYWKVLTDPLYPAVTDALSIGKDQPLADLGCGAGLFAFFLKTHAHTGPIQGLDVDAEKVTAARSIAARHWPDIAFTTGDFASWDPAHHKGHVTFLDVLQYLPRDLQHDLLQRAATCITAPNHRLIIRNGLSDTSWRARVTHTTDHMARWIRWMARSPLSHPTRQGLEAPLRAAGLELTFTPLWGGTPFNNYLIVARRPA
jgi:SAM-dependent methyltransferase